MGERTRYRPGTFCRAGLATSDPAAAVAFYTSLFDCSAGSTRPVTAAAPRSPTPAAARERTQDDRAGAGTAPHWLPYFTVGNADDAALHAGQANGRTLVPPTGTRTGRIAVIADPQGATFTVYEGQTDPCGAQRLDRVLHQQARKESQ